MPLHPQAQAIISGVESMGLPPVETMSVEEQRAVIGTFSSFMMPAEDVATVEDLVIPGPEGDIPLRIYTPEGDGLRPAVVYFHGGGFVTGSVDLVDPLCRALANRSGCLVISVDYRLAPEHPYPAAVQDAYVAIAWVSAYGEGFGVDPTRLAVAGDSAGATLATVACMLIRDKAEEIPIALQVLLCPVMDLVSTETDSYKEYGEGYLLTTAMMQRWKELYLTGVRGPGGRALLLTDPDAELRQPPAGVHRHRRVRPAARRGRDLRPAAAEGRRGRRHPPAGRDDPQLPLDGGGHRPGREIIDEIAADLRKRLFD